MICKNHFFLLVIISYILIISNIKLIAEKPSSWSPKHNRLKYLGAIYYPSFPQPLLLVIKAITTIFPEQKELINQDLIAQSERDFAIMNNYFVDKPFQAEYRTRTISVENRSRRVLTQARKQSRHSPEFNTRTSSVEHFQHSVPVLIFQGTADGVTPVSNGKRHFRSSNSPLSRLYLIHRGGHEDFLMTLGFDATTIHQILENKWDNIHKSLPADSPFHGRIVSFGKKTPIKNTLAWGRGCLWMLNSFFGF